jgi:hypothetical protein
VIPEEDFEGQAFGIGIKFGGRNGFSFMHGDPRLGMKSGFWNEV